MTQKPSDAETCLHVSEDNSTKKLKFHVSYISEANKTCLNEEQTMLKVKF